MISQVLKEIEGVMEVMLQTIPESLEANSSFHKGGGDGRSIPFPR
jgi:hypothetical protein